jgi:hypothetical protein
MLKNHCQPCSDQGVLCHTTLPHGSIPPITRSRILGQQHIMVIAIFVKMYSIFKKVSKECVQFLQSRAVLDSSETALIRQKIYSNVTVQGPCHPIKISTFSNFDRNHCQVCRMGRFHGRRSKDPRYSRWRQECVGSVAARNLLTIHLTR